jgi:hypothetical protein
LLWPVAGISFNVLRCLLELTFDLNNQKTTFSNGSLGSCTDEERSKLRYVM